MKKRFLLGIVAISTFCVQAQDQERAFLPPTMGWSSWNTFAANISENIIKGQADAAVEKGFAEAGYKYINIDDGFFYNRDENGRLLIHPTRFPNGLRPVVDYIHSKGLKAGIYSDAGHSTCASYWANPREEGGRYGGMLDHEAEDCKMYFDELDFDFIKVDFCGGKSTDNFEQLQLDPQTRYTDIRAAIDACDKKGIVYNLCNWNFPGTWATSIADSWRVSEDIYDGWASIKSIALQSLYLSAYCGGGHYNDMDMLEVGRSLTADEDVTHFGLWCIMSSPLLIGCDMGKVRESARELLLNPELIALNQDPLGLQAYVAKAENGTYILVKDIETLNGLTRAVALFNPNDAPKNVTLTFSDVDLGGDVAIRNLVTREDEGVKTESVTYRVPKHGTVLLKLTATQRLVRTLYEAETAWLTEYQEWVNNVSAGTANYVAGNNCSGGMKVNYLGNRDTNDLQWRNVVVPKEGDYEVTLVFLCKDERKVYVSVNGEEQTVLTCQSGSAAKIGKEVFKLHLQAGNNVIRLHNADGPMPDIDCLKLEADNEQQEEVHDYSVCSTAQGNNDPDYGRKTTEIRLTTAEGTQTIATGQNSVDAPVFYDLTSTESFTCKVGEELVASTNYNGTWMHHYVFVDEDNNGFEGEVNEDTHMPATGSDIKTYSYYGGYNSLGEGGLSSQPNLPMPPFNAPAKAGTYRMRYKIDWDSVDPRGTEKDVNKGGLICDVMLVVKGDDDAVVKVNAGNSGIVGYDLSGRHSVGNGLQIVNGKKIVK